MPDDACGVCGQNNQAELRWLPRVDPQRPGGYSLARVCETCVLPMVEGLRSVAHRAAMNEDDEEAELKLLLLVAMLKANGLEVTEANMGGLSGMKAICHGVHKLLDSLERQMLCSQCGAVGPESGMTVIPWFNTELAQYVTTFRCAACVGGSLMETISRVQDARLTAEFDSLGSLLRYHGVFVHEWLRGDDTSTVRSIFLRRPGDVANLFALLRHQ